MKKKYSRLLTLFLFLIFCVLIIYFSKSLFKPLLISVIFAYLLNPLVKKLISFGAGERISIILIITVFSSLTVLMMLYLVPMIIRDGPEMVTRINSYTENFLEKNYMHSYEKLPKYLRNIFDENLLRLQSYMHRTVNMMFMEMVAFSSKLPSYALTPVFVYYFLKDKILFTDILKWMIPNRVRRKVMKLCIEIEKVIGSFLKDQFILAAIVIGLTYLAMLILGMKYAFIIAIINGVANFVPYFGIIIGFLPALIIAASISIEKVVFVSIAFFIIQQVESNLIAPKLMGESMGLHPMIIIIALIIGGIYFGAFGLILSVPVAGILKVSYSYIMKNIF